MSQHDTPDSIQDRQDIRGTSTRWVSVGNAAAALHMTPDGIRKAVRRGRLTARKLAGRWEVQLPPTVTSETFGINGVPHYSSASETDRTIEPDQRDTQDRRDLERQDIQDEAAKRDTTDSPIPADNQDERDSRDGNETSLALDEVGTLRLTVTHLETLTAELRHQREYLEGRIAAMERQLAEAEVERSELRRLALAAQSQVQQSLALLPAPPAASAAEQERTAAIPPEEPPASQPPDHQRRRWWQLW